MLHCKWLNVYRMLTEGGGVDEYHGVFFRFAFDSYAASNFLYICEV